MTSEGFEQITDIAFELFSLPQSREFERQN